MGLPQSMQAKVEQELLEMTESLQSLPDDLRGNTKCVIDPQYVDSFKELVEVRDTLSHILCHTTFLLLHLC